MIKNLIISVLMTTVVTVVAPFTDTTTEQCIVWFVVTTAILTLSMMELDNFIVSKKGKKREPLERLSRIYHIDK